MKRFSFEDISFFGIMVILFLISVGFNHLEATKKSLEKKLEECKENKCCQNLNSPDSISISY